MSLEQSIASLADAINAHANALNALVAASTGQAVGKSPEKASPAATAAAATHTTAPADDAQGKKGASSAKKGDESKPATAEAIDFETQISQPIITLARTGKRDAALSILGAFGAKKASELKASDYPAVLAELRKIGAVE